MAAASLTTEDEVRTEVRSWLESNWIDEGRGARWLAELVDAGWAAPSWPSRWCGRDLTPALSRVVEQELARAGAAGGGQDMVNLWAATVLSGGSDELKGEVLRPLLLGEINMCLLYSEPGAGSDLAGLQTRAVRDGDEWIVNGQKVWTSSGRSADYGFLIARTDWDVPKHRGITFFFAPMDQDGVEVRPLRQATGDSRFNEVFLTDARVPHANILGDQNQGWMMLQTALAYERSAMGQAGRRGRDQRAGAGVRTVDSDASAPVPDVSLIELAQRTGASSDPTVRQGLTRLHALTKVNEWNGMRAKAALEAGTSTPIVSLGKLAMSGILHSAASLQAEILGAEAMLGGSDHPVAADTTYALLNAFFTSIGGGTDQIQRNIIGERILGLPKEPEVDKDVPFRDVRTSIPGR